MNTQELAVKITEWLENYANLVVIPVIAESKQDHVFFILPAEEGTPKDFRVALSRAKICSYDLIGYVEYMDAPNAQQMLDALTKTFPTGYTIMSVPVKGVRVRNLLKEPADHGKHHNMSLQGQMAYARIMLENLNKTALPRTEQDGITYELAKPTLPSKCPRCGYTSYCDAAWIRSTDPEMPPTIMKACPCGQSVIEARPQGEPSYIVTDLTDQITGMKGNGS